jgi:hypothetical protein
MLLLCLPCYALTLALPPSLSLAPSVGNQTLEWAEASGGLLLRHDAQGKRYEPLQFPAPVKWAKLKRPERAIEKLLRSYGGDMSKLCDICRQSIVRCPPPAALRPHRCAGSGRRSSANTTDRTVLNQSHCIDAPLTTIATVSCSRSAVS